MQRFEIQKRFEAEEALNVLNANIDKIRYVKEWANLSGCSKSKLNNIIKTIYHVTPKELLRKERLKKIEEVIIAHPKMTSYAVAVECGLRNDKNLYKFLKINFDTTFTDLKFCLIWEDKLLDLNRKNS